MPLTFSAAEKSVTVQRKKMTHSKLSIPHTTIWWDNYCNNAQHIKCLTNMNTQTSSTQHIIKANKYATLPIAKCHIITLKLT